MVTEMQNGSLSFLMINPHTNTIYWTNVIKNTIEKIDLDGKQNQTYSFPELYHFIIKTVIRYLHVSINTNITIKDIIITIACQLMFFMMCSSTKIMCYQTVGTMTL